jgi:hypothetical protein
MKQYKSKRKMKKLKSLFLILVFALISIATQAQMLIEVVDTTYQHDPRLQYLQNTIISEVARFMQEYETRAKISGDTVLLFAAESRQLVRELEAATSRYAANFMKVDTLSVDPESIVEEYDKLNAQITNLQQDPDIKYIEAMSEFKNIQDRQAKLADYYSQIEQKTGAQVWSYPTEYVVGDKAVSEGTIYTCIKAHTSQENAPPKGEPTLWEKSK